MEKLLPSYIEESWLTQYYHKARFNEVMKLLGLWEKFSKDGLVLDVGCGRGNYGRHLRSSRYLGFDINAQSLKNASNLHDAEYVCADAKHIPVKDNSFDLVLCSEVLEHLDDPSKSIKEVIRVSKKLILLTFPDEKVMGMFGIAPPDHISKIQALQIKNILKTSECKITYHKILYFFLPCITMDVLKIPVKRTSLRLANILSYYLSLSFLKKIALSKTHVLLTTKQK